jgi:hypothetical protein
MAVKVNSIIVRLTKEDLENILAWYADYSNFQNNGTDVKTKVKIKEKQKELEKLNS